MALILNTKLDEDGAIAITGGDGAEAYILEV